MCRDWRCKIVNERNMKNQFDVVYDVTNVMSLCDIKSYVIVWYETVMLFCISPEWDDVVMCDI